MTEEEVIDKIEDVLSLAEYFCENQQNGITDGEICIAALKDIRKWSFPI